MTGDVLVRAERIVAIADRIDTGDLDKPIDATALVLLPRVVES
jgi:dihydroorotase-like cyclic amidohydrolase